MALTPALEELLKTMTPEEAKAQRAIFEKYPQFGEASMRQSDYDRNMNETKEAKKKADDLYEANKKWQEEKTPLYETAVAEAKRLKEEKEALALKVETAVKLEGGTDATAIAAGKEAVAKLEARFGEFVPKAEVDKMVKGIVEAQVQAERDQFFKSTVPALTNMNMDLAEIAYDHKAEFKEAVDRDAIHKLMTERGLTAKKAYDEWITPKRQEAEIAKKVQAGVDAELKKLQSHDVPGTTPAAGGTPGANASPLELTLMRDAAPAGGDADGAPKGFEPGVMSKLALEGVAKAKEMTRKNAMAGIV